MARPESPIIKNMIAPLEQRDAQMFNELVQVNNAYSKELGEKAKKTYIIQFLEKKRTVVQKSKNTEFETMESVLPQGKLSYKITLPKKEVLEKIDKELTQFKNSLKATEGKLSQLQDMYKESLIRTYKNMERLAKGLSAKDIVPDRQVIEEEQVLFESEFDKLIKNEETQKEFKEAKKEAVKRNKARKTKNQK